MRTSEAAAYVTEEFYAALEVFYVSETLGCLPFSGGWAEQPAWIATALSVLKAEKRRVDEEERAARQTDAEGLRKHGRR
jgi:hypothetical protein